jgi:hypothetical protein
MDPEMRVLRCAAAVVLMGLAFAAAPAAETENGTPLADLLEVIVTSREVVALDASGGGQIAIPLRLDEQVQWKGVRGKVAVVLTDQRALAIATQSAAWQQAPYQRAEVPPRDATLGDRVAVVVTSNRALGFTSGSGNLVEYRLGPQEVVRAVRAGESVAVVVTDRRALGLSPASGGFFQAKLSLHERIENVTTRATLATVSTDRRILIFRGPTGSWQERNLSLR